MAGTTADKLQAILNSKAAIKTAINNLGNIITDSTPLDEYASGIESAVDSIFDGTITKIKSNVTRVSSYAFYMLNNLTDLELTLLTTTEPLSGTNQYVVNNCTSLKNLYCPELVTISGSSNMFMQLSSIEEITDTMFPKLETISNGLGSLGICEYVKLSNLTTLNNGLNSLPIVKEIDLSECPMTTMQNSLRYITSTKTAKSDYAIIKLPITLTSMTGTSNFQQSRLKEVWVYNDNAIISGLASALSNTNNNIPYKIDVYVPSSILATYQADSDFSTLVSNNKITLNAIPE